MAHSKRTNHLVSGTGNQTHNLSNMSLLPNHQLDKGSYPTSDSLMKRMVGEKLFLKKSNFRDIFLASSGVIVGKFEIGCTNFDLETTLTKRTATACIYILYFQIIAQCFVSVDYAICVIPYGGVEKVICPHNSPLNIKGEAIDIDHRSIKQQYTTLFPLNGTWVVERPVVNLIKQFTLVNYDSRVIIWDIFKSGTTLES